ncbi:hypothetical protein Tco_1281197, partial [Tanacetum coccineum]
NMDAGTQDSYVAGSSGKDKEPTQEYILLPLQPHRTRILVEDDALVAHEKSSKSSPKDNDVQDSKDIAAEANLGYYFKGSIRIHIEQIIAAMMGYRGGSGGCFEMKGLEGDEEKLYDVLFELESSHDELVTPYDATARNGRNKRPYSSALALHVLRRLGSIFTSVYAADQKLKKAYVLIPRLNRFFMKYRVCYLGRIQNNKD